MILRTVRGTSWFMVCVALFAAPAGAAELTPFLDTRPTDRPQSSVGLHFAARALHLRADVTARSDGAKTTIAPHLRSTVALASNMSLETRVDFPEWNTQSALFDAAIEAKFRVHSVLPLFDELEGRVRRSPDGLTRQSLRLGLTENVASLYPGRPIRLRTSAMIEQTDLLGRTPNAVLAGFEAALTGFAPGRSGAESRLTFSYKTESGSRRSRVGSVAYKRSWPLNAAVRVGVDCEFTDSIEEQRRFRLYWRGEF